MAQQERDPNDGIVVVTRENGRRRVFTRNNSPSETVQSDREQADIKQILARYEMTGILTHMRNVDLQYRDISEFQDLADAMRQAKVAEAEFMRLPPEVRRVFDNDVAEWLDAAHDPEKIEARRPQLERLGLLDPLPEPPAPPPPPPPAPAAE